MSSQTAYFNLVTRLTTVTGTGSTAAVSSYTSGIQKAIASTFSLTRAVEVASGVIMYRLAYEALNSIYSFVSGSVDAFVEFEYAMAGAQRTIQDFTDFEPELNEFASTMSQELGISAKEVAEAMQFMGSVGYDSQGIMNDFNDIAKMGVALQIDLEDAISNVVKAQQIWNKEGMTATEISDQLNEYTNRTAINMDFLTGALRMGGPAAAATNTSLAEMMSILVELAEAGFQGTMAGRSLNTILVQMGIKSGELITTLKDLKSKGFDVNLEAMEGFKSASPIDQIKMLAEATDGLGEAQRIQIAKQVAGTNFLKQMLILMNNATDLTDNYKISLGAAGSTQEEFNVVMDTSQKQLEQQEQRIKSLQREIGQRLTPIYLDLKERILETGEALVNFALGEEKTEKQTEAIAAVNENYTRVLNELYSQLEQNMIGEEQYEQAKADATEARDNAIATIMEEGVALEKVTTDLDDYVDSSRDVERATIDVGTALSALNVKYIDYQEEIDAARVAADEMERVLAFLSGSMTEAEFNTVDLSWATAEARDMYKELDSQLQEVNAELSRWTQALDENADATWNNNHTTAELRYEQLLLEQGLRDGTITQKQYENQMGDLEDQMLDARVESARLSLQQMELQREFDDSKEAADLLESQITLLKDADDKLEGAINTLSSAIGDLKPILEAIDTTLSLLQGELYNTEDAADDMGDELEDSIKDAKSVIGSQVFDIRGYLTSLQDKINSLHGKTIYIDYKTRTSGVTPPDDAGDAGWLPPDARKYGGDEIVTKPTLFLAGEAGPERVTVTPLSGMSRVGDLNAGGNASMASGGRGGNIGNVNIYLPNVTSVENPDQVKQIFRRVMLELSGER